MNLFRRRPADDAATTLYAAVIDRARAPDWYLAGVPDTLDGRFDMVAAVLSLVLIRLEREPDATGLSVRLTELFVDDMDAQVRQIGFGDIVVGKQIGRMMAMLGGRLGAYRDGLAIGSLDTALVRNVWRGVDPGGDVVAQVGARLRALHAALADTTLDDLRAGRLP